MLANLNGTVVTIIAVGLAFGAVIGVMLKGYPAAVSFVLPAGNAPSEPSSCVMFCLHFKARSLRATASCVCLPKPQSSSPTVPNPAAVSVATPGELMWRTFTTTRLSHVPYTGKFSDLQPAPPPALSPYCGKEKVPFPSVAILHWGLMRGANNATESQFKVMRLRTPPSCMESLRWWRSNSQPFMSNDLSSCTHSMSSHFNQRLTATSPSERV
jgi:hypothetical protein